MTPKKAYRPPSVRSRSPLAARILAMEDRRLEDERIIWCRPPLDGNAWDELVSLASAVEVVDATEAAEKLMLVEALLKAEKIIDTIAYKFTDCDEGHSGCKKAECDLVEIKAALAPYRVKP